MKPNRALILKEMKDYALVVGFPDKMSHKQFLKHHVNPMFKVLLAKGLVKSTWYNAYRQAAVLRYQIWYTFNRK